MTPPNRRVIALLLIVALAMPLAACGKRAPPQPPAGEKSTFPKIYPNPNEQ